VCGELLISLESAIRHTHEFGDQKLVFFERAAEAGCFVRLAEVPLRNRLYAQDLIDVDVVRWMVLNPHVSPWGGTRVEGSVV
jgi:hypothetical protein